MRSRVASNDPISLREGCRGAGVPPPAPAEAFLFTHSLRSRRLGRALPLLGDVALVYALGNARPRHGSCDFLLIVGVLMLRGGGGRRERGPPPEFRSILIYILCNKLLVSKEKETNRYPPHTYRLLNR